MKNFTILKHLRYAIVFLFFLSANISGAQCTDNISLTTQQQVNDFAANYPCADFVSITISGTDIYSLSPLTNINSVQTLSIAGTNIVAVDIVNLSNVSVFHLSDNPNLLTLTGLNSLITVDTFIVYQNPALQSIAGIENINLSSMNNLLLIDNPNLNICNEPQICSYLASDKLRIISGNSADCYNELNVMEACGVTIPSSQLLPEYCGINVSTPYYVIYAQEVPEAEMYRFKVGDTIIEKESNQFSFNDFPEFTRGMQYSVSVSIRLNNLWTNYGSSCTLTAPLAPPVTQINPLFCGTAIASTQTPVYVVPVPGAQVYVFEIFSSITRHLIASPNNFFRFADFPSDTYVPGESVSIRVMVYVNSQGGPLSDFCTMIAPVANCAPPVVQDQTYCINATVASLEAEGEALKFYLQATGGTPLTGSKKLVSGTYYVSSGSVDCESVRIPFNVTIYYCGSKLSTNFCNSIQSFNTPIYADGITGATQYRFRVTNDDIVQSIDKSVRYFKLSDLDDFEYNTTYYIDVAVFASGQWSAYGDACTITTPALPGTQIMPEYCGTTVPFTANIYAEGLQYATSYRFRITNGSTTEIVEKGQRYFTVNQIPGYTYNQTYTVDVAARINGQWGAYGTACDIFTPVAPTSQLAGNYCGETMPKLKSIVYANGIAQATRYRFRIFDGDNTYVLENSSRYFALYNVPGNTYGKTYIVEVAVRLGSVWGPYGAACTVSTPNLAARPGTAGPVAQAEAGQVTDMITVTAYPNPYTDTFAVAMDTPGQDKVTVQAFDMNGRLVEDITVSVEELAAQRLGGRYSAGVYNVIVSQGHYQKTFKIVKS